MGKFSFAAAIIVGSMCFSGVPTYASVMFETGNHPQPGEENVLFGTTQTGTLVDGTSNKSGVTVDFSSTQTLTAGGGQAKVEALGALLTNITISSPGHTFTDLIFNPEFGTGTAMVTATTADGTPFPLDGGLALGKGNNFLTITTRDGETISSVTIDAASGFKDLKQPRISGISGVTVPVPEASAVTLISLVLLAFGALLFRARRGEVA
jgi:hypothetical protein